MNLSKLFIAMGGAILPITTVLAAVPADVDARWKQPATITHPEHAFYPNPDATIQASRKNTFDWRTQHLQIGMSNVTGDKELKVSPFYICEVDSLYNIPGGQILTGDIMGPGNKPPAATSCALQMARSIMYKTPDMNPDEGWEVVKFNLGYKMSHYKNAKSTWSADGDDSYSTNQYPYIILYNRMTAKLRVMGYFPGYSVGTGMAVTLSTSAKTKMFNNNQAVDAKFYQASKNGYGAINNALDGAWGIADFNIELDPCSPGSDIDLNIKIQPKAYETVELYGHAVGTSQNITNDNIGDPSKFLMDVSGNLQDNLDQAGSYTVSTVSDLNDLFDGVNDSATADAVASDALGAASSFLAGMMEMAPETPTTKGLKAMAGVLGGAGSIMGTQAAAVPNFSPIIPQISFSEIYLRGQTETADTGVTVKLKLPGSLSTVWTSFDENAVSTRSYPLYDEPMGLFTLLTTPKVRVLKSYSERDNSKGYKLKTTFVPGNVVLVSNAKSGLTITGWAGVEKKGLNITGRLKIKYLVDSNVTPAFNNLHDIDGDDSSFSYVSNMTNGRSTKLYTVVTNEAPLLHLNRVFTAEQIPSITVQGGTAVVDNVSLVVTAKNSTATLHDNILNKDIAMINKTDSNGKFVPYYIAMKEYPVIFNESANKSFSAGADIQRLIDSGQIKNYNWDNKALGIGIRLGASSTPAAIKGFCSASGEYNKPQYNTYSTNSSYSMVSDEDMAYYAYDPKQVSSPDSTRIQLARDYCGSCAKSRTFAFISFNLNEYVGLYGFKKPKNVYVRTYKHGAGGYGLDDYSSKYYLSANKSTPAMIETAWDAERPAYASPIKDLISQAPWDVNVTKQFNAALDRVKNSNGKYEQPRLSFALIPKYVSWTDDYPAINASEVDPNTYAPRLLIEF